MNPPDFESAVPPHDPAEDALALAGRAALSVIPGIGGIASEVISHTLATRDKELRHKYDVKIAQAMDVVFERLAHALTLDDIITSDEFLAAVNYTRRIASESASDAKRDRLARAAVEAGSWSDFTASERAGFLRLVAKYDDLHIWLLAYFADPVAWLDAHDLAHVHEDVTSAETGTQIAYALDVGFGTDRSSDDVPAVVQDALEELAMDSVLSPIILSAIRDRPFAAQATSRGRRFLAYLRESSSDTPAPTDL